eukprot:9871667-Alexandrium_andersonii.AAC.1
MPAFAKVRTTKPSNPVPPPSPVAAFLQSEDLRARESATGRRTPVGLENGVRRRPVGHPP